MFQKFATFKKDLIENCKSCNACFKNCYAFQKTEFSIMEFLPEFFQEQKYVKEIKKFLDSCLYCKIHESSCIRSIDLSLLLPTIKYDLRNIDSRYVWKPQNIQKIFTKVLSSEKFYRFWRNLNYEIIPREFRRKFEEHRQPQKRDVVLFSGCGIQLLENQYYTLCEIFKKLDINFGLIDGSYIKPVCCGAVHFEVGNFEHGIYMLKNLVNEVKRFKTKRIVVYCATCYYGLKVLAPELLENFDLEIIHATGYLLEFLKNKPIGVFETSKFEKKIYTIHDSCHLAHGPKGDTVSIRGLISLLPNTEIVEMKHNREKSLCDLYYVLMGLRNPLTLLMRKKLIHVVNEAVDTKADILCSLCPGCHALLTIFGSNIMSLIGNKKPKIFVKNWVSIVGEYLGIKMRDMLIYRFKHVFIIPIKDSGFWFLWQAFKAFIRGYFGKKEPKPIERKRKK